MALTNKQKRTIIKTAKDNGYNGDYTSLFNQAESEGVFNNTAPAIPVPQLTKEDINFAEADDYKFNPKSLLVDRTPHRFNDNDNFITSSHSVKPNNKSILRFLNDPDYTPTAEPNMGEHGGFHPNVARVDNTRVTKVNPNLKISETPDQTLLQKATNPIRKNLAENLYPRSYANPAKRLWEAGIKGKKQSMYDSRYNESSGLNSTDESSKLRSEDPDMKERIDLLQMVMGQPQKNNLIQKSKYKPTKGKDGDMQYYTSPETDKFMRKIIEQYGWGKAGEYKTLFGGGVLGEFKVSSGEDERGEYISYYDKWDLNPLDHIYSNKKLNNLVDKTSKAVGITSPEIYNRIYKDEIEVKSPVLGSNRISIEPPREDGGIKKYHEGGPNEGPHPDHHEGESEDTRMQREQNERNIDAERRTLEADEESTGYSVDRLSTDIKYGPSQINNNIQMQTYLDINTDGDFGPNSKKTMFNWSNKNLNSLPVYNPEFKTMDIKCKGRDCSQQTTNVLQLVYPHLDRDQLEPDDSWYRRDKILQNGGRDIWSQDTKELSRNKLVGIPPMEVWNTFQIGDIVSMDSSEDSSFPAGPQGQANDGSEHTGFIIGRHHETGIPLVMHGYRGSMEVDPINELKLGNMREGSNATYLISGITRPSAMGDGETNNYTFDKLNLFLEKPDFATHNYFSFDEDYLEGMNDDEREMADQFSNFFNGSTRRNIEQNQNEQGEWEDTWTNEVLTPNDSSTDLADISAQSLKYGENAFNRSHPIQKISNITGYSRDEVSKAAMMTWGFYQNETGDANSIRQGKAMEWVKDNMSSKNAAKLKALKKGDVTWNPSILGGIFNFDINEEDYMYSAQQEASRGILRIKYNMQTTNLDGDLTRVGAWVDSYGIYSSDDLTAEDNSENTLISGTPGTVGVQNSFAMGTMLTLSYYENIRRKPGYDPETETYKGVPIDYVVATMHKGLNLNSQAGDGNTILQNLQKGDRSYSNVTINAANQLSYTTSELDTKMLEEHRLIEAVLDSKVISKDNKPFKSSIDFTHNK